MTSSALARPDDEATRLEASRQIGRPVGIERTHIRSVRAYDTVFHQGKAQTVCVKDLRNDAFMGRTLFGDSYILGQKPILRIVM